MNFKLEKNLNEPSDILGDYTLMLVGEKKVGKTSLAIQFNDAYVLEFEPGNAAHLKCYYKDIHNWDEANSAIEFIKNNPDFCQTLIIDDVPSAYQYCLAAVRKRLKLSDEEKPGFTGWDICSRWFDKWIRSIEALPIGRIYTAHVQVEETETRTGRTVSQLQPSWSKQCRTILEKYIKLTGYIMMTADKKSPQRELIIVGDDFVKANNGFSNHFLQNGNQVKSILLTNDPKVGYQNLISAWNNKEEKKGKPKAINLEDL